MKFEISSPFGAKEGFRNHIHNGIDIPMIENTTLRSVTDGVVEAIRDYGTKNIGKGIVIKAKDGSHHIYGHLNEINVVKGQHIQPGEVIGLTGNTGNSTGAHLHFGIQTSSGKFIDPTEYAEPLTEMAGNVPYKHVLEVAKTIDSPGWIMGKINGFSDWAVGKEAEYIGEPLARAIKSLFVAMWDWFIINLPDIMGYSAILAAICIILGSMFGRDGMMKPLAIFAGALILAVCILGGV